ncbi:MAG: hypothetical protein KF878_02060 [Planctomycetes bacterium]|nr:hypothetical protein [Planctomycetota bacterium]
MDGGEPHVPADRRAAARERLRARAPRDDEPTPSGPGEHLVERPWLGVLVLGAAAVAPGLVCWLLRLDEGSVLRRDIGLHDLVARRPWLCGVVVGGAALGGLAWLVAFMAGWI